MKLTPQSLATTIVDLMDSLPEAKQSHLADAVTLFLEVQGQLRLLRLLPPYLERAYYQKQNIARVDVSVAEKSTPAELKDLEAALHKALAKKIELHEHKDESLIGGARIAIGDERLDFSLSSALKTVSQQLSSH